MAETDQMLGEEHYETGDRAALGMVDGWTCPRCGQNNVTAHAFCVFCGQATALDNPETSTSPWLWVSALAGLGLVLLLCLGAAGGAYFWSGGFNRLPDASPTAVNGIVASRTTAEPKLSFSTAVPTAASGRETEVPTMVSVINSATNTPTSVLAVNTLRPATPTSLPPAMPSTAPPATPTVAPSATRTSVPSPAPATGTPRLANPTPDSTALQREQSALAVHPGYGKFQHTRGDFAVNIPSDWQSLAEDAKGKLVVLGNQTTRNTMIVEMSAPGRSAADILSEWTTTMKGTVKVAPMKTAMGHYEARQAVLDLTTPYPRRVYGIAISTPNKGYLLTVDGPAGDLNVDIDFDAAAISFRTPARCGITVCTDLLPLDSVVGQPVPMPHLAP